MFLYAWACLCEIAPVPIMPTRKLNASVLLESRSIAVLQSVLRSADADFQAQVAEHGGLHRQRQIGARGVRGVGDLNVVGLVPGHELVARDAAG